MENSRKSRQKLIKIVPGGLREIQFKFFRLIVFTVSASTVLAAAGFYGVITLVLRTSQLGPYAEMRLQQVFFWVNALFGLVIIISVLVAGVMSFSLSHRIAGPIYRIETVLKEIIRTGEAQDIKIRRNDEFSSLVKTLNELIEKYLAVK